MRTWGRGAKHRQAQHLGTGLVLWLLGIGNTQSGPERREGCRRGGAALALWQHSHWMLCAMGVGYKPCYPAVIWHNDLPHIRLAWDTASQEVSLTF